jgi:pyruvate,water dikinase
LLPLIEAEDEAEFGGKSTSLGTALRAGLKVPSGYALSHECVGAVVGDEQNALDQLASAFEQMKKPIAVRSSAIGEDSEEASFAGQHLTVLNVVSFEHLKTAIGEVFESVLAISAQSYRERLGVEGAPRMGIVLQELFHPVAAGVMFTRNPLNHAEERVIEAAWGLGEVVVEGLVIPDYYRLSPDGEVLESRVGDKDLVLQLLPDGGTEEVDVPLERATARILDDDKLYELHQLALRCESVYGKDLDIEWGMDDQGFVLLQCRSITTTDA